MIVYPQTDFIDPSPLSKCDAVVIGPGLSRSKDQLQLGYEFLCKAKELDIPVVLDADGLYLPLVYPNFFLNSSLKSLLLTPNKREFKVLCDHFGIVQETGDEKEIETLKQLAMKLHACIVLKGSQDYIVSHTSPKNLYTVDTPGGLRRCGGQGDLLAGSIATFLAWSKKSNCPNEMIASYAACCLIRTCSRIAFEKQKRGMICIDIISEIPCTFDTLFHKTFE